jgi:sugar-specific transcriptional regulator TrmB
MDGGQQGRSMNLPHIPGPKIYSTLERISKKKYIEVMKGTPAFFLRSALNISLPGCGKRIERTYRKSYENLNFNSVY